MAAVTEHVEFTTGVYIAPARDLMTVAKQVGTAAVLSSGRVALGVGSGGAKRSSWPPDRTSTRGASGSTT